MKLAFLLCFALIVCDTFNNSLVYFKGKKKEVLIVNALHELKTLFLQRDWKIVNNSVADVHFLWICGWVKDVNWTQDLLINKFPNRFGLTTKTGLYQKLKRNALTESGVNYLDFYPLSYSLGVIEDRLDFIDHFRLFKSKCVLRNFLRKLARHENSSNTPRFTPLYLLRVHICLIFSEAFIESNSYLLQFQSNNSLLPPPPRKLPPTTSSDINKNKFLFSNSTFSSSVSFSELDWYVVSRTCVENVTVVTEFLKNNSAIKTPIQTIPVPELSVLTTRVGNAFPLLFELLSSANMLNAQILLYRNIYKKDSPLYTPLMKCEEKKNVQRTEESDVYSLLQSGIKNLWVVKPSSQSGGTGIEVLDDLSEILLIFWQNKKSGGRLVQKYLDQTMLVSKHKFDIRFHVLVSSHSPLYLFLHNNWYCRFSLEVFNLSDITAKGKHITNFHFQNKSPTFKLRKEAPWMEGMSMAGNLVEDDAFKQRLRKMDEEATAGAHMQNVSSGLGDGENDDVDETELDRYSSFVPTFSYAQRFEAYTYPVIKKLITIAVKSSRAGFSEKGKFEFAFRNKSFQIFGFDIILDVNMRPWLLEVNGQPGMDYVSRVHVNRWVEMLNDTLKVVIDNELFTGSNAMRILDDLAASKSSSSSSSLPITTSFSSSSSLDSTCLRPLPFSNARNDALLKEFYTMEIDTGKYELISREKSSPKEEVSLDQKGK